MFKVGLAFGECSINTSSFVGGLLKLPEQLSQGRSDAECPVRHIRAMTASNHIERKDEMNAVHNLRVQQESVYYVGLTCVIPRHSRSTLSSAEHVG